MEGVKDIAQAQNIRVRFRQHIIQPIARQAAKKLFIDRKRKTTLK
jgi:hypothetical protein